jgi:hypothetical protein
MSSARVPCDFCQAPIGLEEFERGRAVILLKKRYCSKCMAAALKRSKQKHSAPALAFHTPPPQSSSYPRRRQRRHDRKECSMPVELSVHLTDGRLYDRGRAMLWNISLSGALLRALVLPLKALPVDSHLIGIRVLEGPLKDLRILGRPARFEQSEDGLHLAIEFVRTTEVQIRQLRKFV